MVLKPVIIAHLDASAITQIINAAIARLEQATALSKALATALIEMCQQLRESLSIATYGHG